MMEGALGRCVGSWCPGATGVVNAVRLSGGASQETWSFDIVHPDGVIGAILRRAPVGYGLAPARAVGLNAEAVLMQSAYEAGVPSPRVLHVLQPRDELGTGFVMARVEGETIARKILRDTQFAQVRPKLARQLGKVLAGIHGLDLAQLPQLRRMTVATEIAELERDYRGFDWPRPVFELTLRWLRDHDPGPSEEVTLVHGDFRVGNFLVAPDGLQAVLDWEFAHWGSPCEDLAWICVRDWRFGKLELPVGGIAKREPFVRAYEQASGRRVDAREVHFWEVLGNVKWAIGSLQQGDRYQAGEHDLELIAVARRAGEMEYEALRLMGET